MPDPDIHDQLIARLEELRSVVAQWPSHLNAGLLVAFDMAVAYVRQRCPKCEDSGVKLRIKGLPWNCDCNRPAMLAEAFRALDGGQK